MPKVTLNPRANLEHLAKHKTNHQSHKIDKTTDVFVMDDLEKSAEAVSKLIAQGKRIPKKLYEKLCSSAEFCLSDAETTVEATQIICELAESEYAIELATFSIDDYVREMTSVIEANRIEQEDLNAKLRLDAEDCIDQVYDEFYDLFIGLLEDKKRQIIESGKAPDGIVIMHQFNAFKGRS